MKPVKLKVNAIHADEWKVFKSAVVQIQFGVKSKVKLRSNEHKESQREKSQRDRKKTENNRETKKKSGGGRRSFVIFQTKKEKQMLAAFLHLNHLNTFGESWRRYILFWKTDVLLWSHWNATQQRSQHPLKEKAAHARLWRSFFFLSWFNYWRSQLHNNSWPLSFCRHNKQSLCEQLLGSADKNSLLLQVISCISPLLRNTIVINFFSQNMSETLWIHNV